MKQRPIDNSGFTLIELIVAIVVLGIVAAVAMQSLTSSLKDQRLIETEREMERLASAIVGNADLKMGGTRGDFGYVGDIGAFPPNLQALSQNPGGYTTWDGPYIPPGFTQDTDGFKTDGWGKTYSYNGGITIVSTGGGSAVSKQMARASSDYLLNSFTGTVLDASDSVPGTAFMDSIDIEIDYPDGLGEIATKSYNPDSSGIFTLDSLPVGTHALRLIYSPRPDTLRRYVTILPRHKGEVHYYFASDYFAPSDPILVQDTLRPDGAGAITGLGSSGCADNYQCVDETVSDGDAGRLERAANSFASDSYSFENPSDTDGVIVGIEVYCRARRSHAQGQVRPILSIGSTEYPGNIQNLTGSWADYSQEWTVNPATGVGWIWDDIIGLEAGLSLKGQNNNFPAYATQVWMVVTYSQ